MIEILRLSLPITIWLVGFSAVYAVRELTCSRHWPADLDARTVLVAGFAIAVAMQVISLLATVYAPSRSRFVQTASMALAVTALVASIWTLIPVLVTSICL